jgi:hypothetical protein
MIIFSLSLFFCVYKNISTVYMGCYLEFRSQSEHRKLNIVLPYIVINIINGTIYYPFSRKNSNFPCKLLQCENRLDINV